MDASKHMHTRDAKKIYLIGQTLDLETTEQNCRTPNINSASRQIEKKVYLNRSLYNIFNSIAPMFTINLQKYMTS